MKTIDISNIEDGYKVKLLQGFFKEKCQELIHIQAAENDLLDLCSDDISIVVKYINDELTIFVGTNEAMKGAVKNGEI